MPSFATLHDRGGGKRLLRLLALLVALAVSTPLLLAQEWDHDHLNGRDKVHDPTGAWLITAGNEQFSLITFHSGGTVTEDIQGESGFDPASVNPPTPPGDIQTRACSQLS